MQNTPENIDKAIAILQAMKRGETIQCHIRGVWKDEPTDYIPDLGWLYDYRIKPAPVKRLIKVEELPEVIWLKNKAGSVFQVVAICDGMLATSDSVAMNRGSCIQFLKDKGVLWSPSRRGPWYSFEMTDEELQKIKEGK